MLSRRPPSPSVHSGGGQTRTGLAATGGGGGEADGSTAGEASHNAVSSVPACAEMRTGEAPRVQAGIAEHRAEQNGGKRRQQGGERGRQPRSSVARGRCQVASSAHGAHKRATACESGSENKTFSLAHGCHDDYRGCALSTYLHAAVPRRIAAEKALKKLTARFVCAASLPCALVLRCVSAARLLLRPPARCWSACSVSALARRV